VEIVHNFVQKWQPSKKLTILSPCIYYISAILLLYYALKGGVTMDKTTKSRVIRLVAFTVLALVGIFLIYLIYHFSGVGFKCPVFEITGFKCAGCGNTHALECLLKLDILSSFSYNYIYPLEIFYIFWVYMNSSISYIKNGKFNYKPPCQVLDIIILIIVVLWIPLRNILGV